jgi:hypothetical protein
VRSGKRGFERVRTGLHWLSEGLNCSKLSGPTFSRYASSSEGEDEDEDEASEDDGGIVFINDGVEARRHHFLNTPYRTPC